MSRSTHNFVKKWIFPLLISIITNISFAANPTSGDNTLSIPEDQTLTIVYSDFNYADTDGDILTTVNIISISGSGIFQNNSSAITAGSTITLADLNSNNFKFIPAANENGNDYASFVFTVTDANDEVSVSYTMTINVSPQNDPPTAVSKTLNGTEDTPLTILATDFGFSDIDGHSFDKVVVENSVFLGTLANNGTTISDNDEVSYADLVANYLTYTPALNGNGDGYASFTFRVFDNSLTNNSSEIRTITFDIASVNDIPTSVAKTINILEDGSKTFSSSDFTITDADGDDLSSIRISGLSITGSLQLSEVDVIDNQVISVSNIPNLVFTPLTDGNGNNYASFEFEVNDGTAYSDSKYLFTINVDAVDDPPTINSITDPADIYEDAGQQEVTVSGITAGGGEPALDISAISVSTPNTTLIQGLAVFSYNSGTGEAVIRYTPVADQYGAATITVVVNDGNSVVSDNFVVDVLSVNDEPTINIIGNQSTNEDTPLNINIGGISAGATNESVQFLTITAESDDTGIVPDGVVSYTQGDPDGTITFTPALNAVGSAQITVTITDNGSTTNPGDDNEYSFTFDLTVNSVNDPPTLADITSPNAVNEDTGPHSVGLSGIGDGDPEVLQNLTISASSNNTSLVETFTPTYTQGNTTATLAYTPKPNAYGEADVDVTISDGEKSVTKRFTITVNPVNDNPTIDPVGIVADIDEDAQEVTIELTGITPGPNEASQSVTVEASSDEPLIIPDPVASYNSGTGIWSISYTPESDQYGSVLITVTVADDDTNQKTATTTFTQVVNPINDPPTLSPIGNISINEDAGVINVPFNGITDDGEVPKNLDVSATSSSTTIISNANITINYSSPNTGGSIDFEANPNQYGEVTITVEVTDKESVSTTQSFQVFISNINDPPTLNDIPTPSAILEDEPTLQTITLTGITAGPNETETLLASVSALNASLFDQLDVTLNGDGTADLDYLPAENANGATTVTVVIDDQVGSNSTIEKDVNISVLPVNDIPAFDIPAFDAISENSGLRTVAGFATNIDDGDPELQTLSFSTAVGIPTSNLSFVTPPSINVSSGTLTYQAAPNTNGQVDVDVTLLDNGGTANGGINELIKTFTISVTAVPAPPTFTLNGNPPVINEDAGAITESNFAQNIDDGDPEVVEALEFDITQSSGSLSFDVFPTIDASSGDLTYTVSANSNGTATFDVVLRETVSGLTSTGPPPQFTITVNAVNDPPVGDNGSITINEDQTHTFQSSDFTFSDIDNHAFEGVQITELPLKGNLLYNGSQVSLGTSYPIITQLTFSPLPNESGTTYTTFKFRVRDESGDLSTSDYTMTIHVDAVSDDPTGASASVNTEEDTNYSFTVGDFPFSDNDGDGFNGIIIETDVGNGSLLNNSVVISTFPTTINNVTQLTYEPPAGQSGTPYTNFTFNVIDATNANSVSDSNSPYTMSINVGAVNDPPTGNNESITMLEDATYQFSPGDFTFNDPDGHTFAGIQITQVESSGSLKYNNADVVVLTNYPDVNLLTYKPPSNQNGAALANFKFKIIDSSTELNISTSSYTMTIDVTPVNDAPIFTITEDPPAINEDAGAQTIVGFASSIDDGDINVVQALNFGLSYTAPSTLTFASPPSIDVSTGNLTYTPNTNAYGTVAINVTLGDDGGTDNGGSDQSSVQQFTLTVNPVNDPPTLNDITDTYSINEDATTFTIDLDGISAGLNENQTIEVTTASSNNSIIPAPSVSYSSPGTTAQLSVSPVANANGSVDITVTVKDGQVTNGSISKTFPITINPVNDPPTLNAITDPDAINEDAITQTIDLEGITAGPNESQALVVTATSDNQDLIPNSAIEVVYSSADPIGSLNYQPLANQSGTANITVLVNDLQTVNNTTTRTFEVEVLPVNDQPTLADLPVDPIEIDEDAGQQTLPLTGISAGGGENQTLSITAISDKPGIIPNPTVGAITSGSATLFYEPVDDKFGLVNITVTVNDGQAINNTISKSFQVDVKPVNDPPTLSAITGSPFTINEDAPTQSITLQGISAGGGESQTIEISAASDDETIIQNPIINYTVGETTATLYFTPEADQSGSVNITVYVNDFSGTNNLVSQSFVVNVTEVNDPPTINDIISPGDIQEDATEQIVSLGGITAGGGESQTLQVSAAEIGGEDIINTITVNYSGNNNATLLFTLQPNANGLTTIEVTVDDQQAVNRYTKKSFNVNVLKVNDLPTLNAIASPYEIDEDPGQQTIGLSGISPGPNESEQTVTITAISDNTDLIPNPTIVDKTADTKDLVFTPVANKNGVAKITVQASDGQATNNTVIREFNVEVAPVNDAPVFDINSAANISENAGLQSIANFAYNINDGDPELTQTLNFESDISGTLSFITQPTISPANGTLTFETTQNSNGQAVVDVTLTDNGTPPRASSIKTFTINVTPVNGEPSFTLNGNPPATNEDAGLITETAFAMEIDDGDPELDQSATLNFILTELSSNINFSTAPDIDPATGNLTYQAASDSYGTAFYSAILSDGNKSSAPAYFTLTINPVNDPPVGANETVLTDEDIPYNFQVADFTYSDVESNPFSGIQIVNLETIGDLEYNGADVTLNQICADVSRLVYKPVLNGNGNNYASFNFKLRDSEGNLSSTYTMTINVNPVDDNPTSGTAEVNTQENITYTFATTDFPFTDPDGHTFNGVRIYSVETRGDLEYQNTDVTPGTLVTNFNQFKFIPAPSENGNPYATFEFEVRDSDGAYSPQYIMSIIVGPVNDRPTGSDENISMLEDEIYTFSTSNFTFNDLDGHAFDGIRIESLETNGDLEYNGSEITDPQTLCPDVSLLTFQPGANENGNGYATFTFKVKDNSASFNLSEFNYTMTINVTAVNDAPSFTISSNPQAVNEDQGSQTITNFATSMSSGDPELTQVLQFNPPNIVSSTGNLSFASGPTVDNSGTLTYQSAPNTYGTVTYSMTMYDDGGGQNTSTAKEFTITVNGINDSPTINALSDVSIDEDAGPQSIDLSNITAGPLENQDLIVTVESLNEALIPAPTINYSTPNTTGSISYTPVANQSGQATIRVTVSDGGAINSSIEESFIVTVNPVNDPPTVDQIADRTILENADEQIINLANITAGGGEDQELLVSVASSNTTLIPTPNLTYLGGSTAQLSFTPEINENGETTITVTVDDQNGEITNMAFKVTVSPVNDPPTIDPIDDPDLIAEDAGQQQINLTGITPGANEDQELAITVESSNTDLLDNFTVDYTYPATEGTLYYTTNQDKFGTAIVTITVNDGSLLDNQVSEQFNIVVKPVADTPSVTNASTDQDNQTTSGLVISRNENDGSEITYFKITNIQNGQLFMQDGITEVINNEYITYEQGSLGLRFTPNSNLDGSFDIQSSLEDADAGLGGNVITADIFINSIPTTNNLPDNLSLNEDSPDINFDLHQYFDDEEDIDSDLVFEVSNTATDVVAAQISNHTLTITFLENQTGTAFITVTCTDTKGAFVEDNIQLVVQPVNDPPIFESTAITVAEQNAPYSYQIITSDIEDNDRDITLVNAPSWLLLNDNDDGTAELTGTPSNDDLGDNPVEIQVEETLSGLFENQIFTIVVTNVNDTPRIVSSPITEIFVGQRYEYTIQVEDPDPDDTYTIIIESTTKPDWLDLITDDPYRLVGLPEAGDIGSFEIKLIVWDNDGASSEQLFTITVSAPNTPPTLVGGFSINVEEDQEYLFSSEEFKNHFQDPDENDSLVSIIIIALPSDGSLKLNGTTVNTNDTISVNDIGNLIYKPREDFDEDDVMIWKGTDGKVPSINDNTINININGVDDPPEINYLESTLLTYQFGDYNVQITETAEVSEADNEQILSAKFSISSNYNRAQDSLAIDIFEGIETNWNDTTGVLSVVADALKSSELFTQILRSLIYINQKRFAPSTETRTIEMSVFDGVSDSDSVLRNIEFEDTFVPPIIPTGITPNEDMVNDTWEIEYMLPHDDAIVRVFSREGNKIFESIGVYQPWDGKNNGTFVKAGIYYYTIEIPKFEKKYSGTITVLR